MSKINFAALNVQTVASDKRAITSPNVARPARDIVAQIHERVRIAAWNACLETVAEMHGSNVEAKGSAWEVDHDDAARAIRVNYNLIQPHYFPKKVTSKMDKEGSRALWTQMCEAMGQDAPVFNDDNDSDE